MILPRPRRLTPPDPIGSLLKQVFAPGPRQRKPEAEMDPDYLVMVRHCPCLSCGMDPCYEAAHVRLSSAVFQKASGMAKKPADKWALPVCPDDHRLARTAQHNHGEQQFWDALGINPLIVCVKLHAQRGDLVAMRAVIFSTIAERGNHG